MILAGNVARFRLSREGKKALKGLFPRDSLQAFVQAVDNLGAWIVIGEGKEGSTGPLMLLKWDYFSTAVLELEIEPAPERIPVGFRP